MKQITMILTNGFEPDVRVYKEALYLTKKGCHVTILCWDRESELPEREKKDGIEIIRFKIRSVYGSGIKQLFAAFKYLAACRKHLKTHPCDYLHCNDLDGVIIGWLARVSETPMVFDMHELYEEYYSDHPKFWRMVTKFFIKKSIAALYVGDIYLGENYKEVRNKLFKLRNYPDSALLKYRPKSESKIFRVGYHGCVRGQILEFTALFEAVKDLADVRVDINGNGRDNSRLKELEKSYTNVYIHGSYDGVKESAKLYENSDLIFCAYPADDLNYQSDDFQPVKYYEAILTGTPMLTTESLSLGKRVVTNGFGLACDTRNANEIRVAILKIMEDKEFWKQCHDNELAVAHKYDWQEEVKVLDKVYNL